jgi:hypothetical protein
MVLKMVNPGINYQFLVLMMTMMMVSYGKTLHYCHAPLLVTG